MKKEERNIYKQKAIHFYLDEKLSMNKIAQKLNISDSTVKKFLIEENIEIRKNNLSYSVKEGLFKTIKTEEDAYWLGLLYADGNVSSKGYSVELDLKEEDKYLVQKFNDYCGVTKPLKKHIIKKNNKEYISYRCNFSNKEAHDNLIKQGCVSAKSLILKCPIKEQVADELLPAFIRGYCDGDGHVRWEEIRHKEIVLVGTQEFLEGIVKRMKWQNIAHICPDRRCKIFRLEIWKMNEVYDILSLLYKDKDLCLKRKQKIYFKAKEYMERHSLGKNL